MHAIEQDPTELAQSVEEPIFAISFKTNLDKGCYVRAKIATYWLSPKRILVGLEDMIDRMNGPTHTQNKKTKTKKGNVGDRLVHMTGWLRVNLCRLGELWSLPVLLLRPTLIRIEIEGFHSGLNYPIS